MFHVQFFSQLLLCCLQQGREQILKKIIAGGNERAKGIIPISVYFCLFLPISTLFTSTQQHGHISYCTRSKGRVSTHRKFLVSSSIRNITIYPTKYPLNNLQQSLPAHYHATSVVLRLCGPIQQALTTCSQWPLYCTAQIQKVFIVK